MPSLEAPRMPLQSSDRANRNPRVSDSSIRKTTPTKPRTTSVKKDTRFKNIMPRGPGQHEHQVYEYDDRHCDPALFHELVEEPDVIFGDDIDALGVTHAGVPDTPVAVRKSAQTAQQGNATRQARQGKPQPRRTDPDVHCDPALFHELVEEPDVVFADDIYALGVTHAGHPDPPRRKTRQTGGNSTQASQPKRYPRATRRTAPSADDLHWDSEVMHEVVEDPDDIFADDIDALGVHHAGVPEPPTQKTGAAEANQAKRYARVRRRNAPSADDLHWDSDVMHEVVEEPDDIFADDIDALGVHHAGVPEKPPAPKKKPARVVTRRLRRAAPNSNDLVWDADIIHEVVEEPEFIFGEDIDALGVKHAGVPDQPQPQPRNAKRKIRVRRVGRPSAEDLRWDVGVMHEIVEDPDAIFGEDIDALGVAHAGVADSPRPTKPTTRRVVRKAAPGKPAHGVSRHRLKRQHADPRLFHELVEEPDAIFADDIDALGVTHAGVPDDNAGKGINISANGIQLNLQTTREGTTVTIKLPKVLQ